MAFDQQIKYRASVDDSDFQAKLSQMRASLDTLGGSMGGTPMFMGGMPVGSMMGMAGMMNMGGSSQQFVGTNMGGLADFGNQIRPITYTPAAIAMQPHFGMIKVQQSLGQSIRGMFASVPGGSMFSDIPEGITAGEYSSFSTMQAGMRVGQAAMIGTGVAASTGAQLFAGSAGFAAGEWAMTKFSHSAADAAVRTGLGLEAGLGGRALLTAGGLAGSMLLSMPLTELADATMTMAADNRSTQNALMAGSGRFITGGPDANPLTGRGFNAKARADVADFIQSRELQDPRFGMKEVSQVLETGMQMDMFSGSRDAEDFKKKFSGLLENVKTITSVLHTSVKDGVEMIRGMRDMGVTDPTEVNRLALMGESMGRASGRTGQEMLALGQTGAEIFRGTNVKMETGAELMMSNVMNIRSALNAGTLSREVVGQAGGEAALAQQMTSSTLASFQTGIGRGALMATFNPQTGQLDQDKLAGMGNQGMMGMLSQATGIGVKGMLTLQAHQSEVIGQLSPQQMQLFQANVLMSHAKMFSQYSGVDTETGFLLAAQQQNVPETVARGMLGMIKAGPEAFRDQQQNAVDAVANQQISEDFRNRFNLPKQISNAVRSTFVQPLQRGLTAISNSIERSFEDVGVALTGGEIMSRDRAPSAVRAGQALRGDRPSGYIDATEEGMQRFLPGKFAGHGIAAAFENEGSAMDVTALDQEQGITKKYSYQGATAMVFQDAAAAKAYGIRNHEQVIGLDHVGWSGQVLATTQHNIDYLHKNGQRFDISMKEKEAGEAAADKLVTQGSFQSAFAAQQAGGMHDDLGAFAGLVLGKKFASQEEFVKQAKAVDIATVSAAMDRVGGSKAMPGASKALGALQGLNRAAGETDAAAAARTDKRASAEAASAGGQLQDIFLRHGEQFSGGSTARSFDREDLAEFGDALKGGSVALQLQKKYGLDTIQKMVSTVKGDKGSNYLNATLENFTSDAAAAADFAAKSRDPDALKADPNKAGQQAGPISQDTRAVMDQMKKYFEQNILVLTKLNDLIQKKI